MPIRSQFKTEAQFLSALRDWFAGQALAGILASPFEFSDVREAAPKERPLMRSVLAYEHAERLLEVRGEW